MTGSYGNILRVNLSEGSTSALRIGEDEAKKYLGGAGLATRILWDETKSDTQPLSPESPLIFMTGPLTGTAVPSSSRHIVAGISPLTGILGQAHSGGKWADEFRRTGWDGIIIKGKAPRPAYLWLHDGKAEIRDASHLWGKDTYEVDELLKKETDDKACVATIGVAGERLVRISCIINDGKEGRAAARCGLGALMGSKRLKAIVVRGTLPVRIYGEEALAENIARVYSLNPSTPKNDQNMVEREIGAFKTILKKGGAPIRNWQQGTFEAGQAIPEKLRDTVSHYCRRCPYSCSESKSTGQGERYMVYEHWAPLGTNCLIDNVEALQKAYVLCNRYGLDCISTGGVIAFAMECYEKGLLPRKNVRDTALSWGSSDGMLEMVRQIGEREGLGELLGDGVRQAAERIGGIAHEYAIHVKGLELPAHDPRAANGLAIAYATGSLGATHTEATHSFLLEGYVHLEDGARLQALIEDIGYSRQMDRFETVGKGELISKLQDLGNRLNSLGVCCFLLSKGRVTSSQFLEILNNVTGWGLSSSEYMKAGERISNLRRMFNVRRGISRKDDTLPARILTRKREDGGAADNLPHLGLMLNEYYRYRGWSEEGIPTRDKLIELGLGEILFT